MQIETARFLTRPFRLDDADALYALLSDSQVMRFLEAPYTREQTLAFLQSAGLCEPPLVWALVDKQTRALTGQLIFTPTIPTALSWDGFYSRPFGIRARPAR